MKTCQNCRCVYADDYAGTCVDCGAGMGGQVANGNGGLDFAFARQVQAGQRENAQENAMRGGRYENVKVEDGLLSVARGFVTVDEKKYVDAGGDLSDLR